MTKPTPAPTVTCPKCARLQSNPDACDRCGLIFRKATALSARAAPRSPGGDALRASLERKWEKIQGQLDDSEAHVSFINLCASLGALDFAGLRYRGLTPPGQAEDPTVAKYRERVLNTAMAQAVRSPKADSPLIRRLWHLAIVVVIIAVGVHFMRRNAQNIADLSEHEGSELQRYLPR